MQLFGIELASQCIVETYPNKNCQQGVEAPATEVQQGSSPGEEPLLMFDALIPKPEADLRRISKGAFFSVDSRPIASTRVTAQKLVSIFKKYLRDHFPQAPAGDMPRDPFIRLDLRCPPGCYDVNVEPSKDDVIFNNEQSVLDQFEAFLSLIYPASQQRDDQPQSSPSVGATETDIPKDVGSAAPNTPATSQVRDPKSP